MRTRHVILPFASPRPLPQAAGIGSKIRSAVTKTDQPGYEVVPRVGSVECGSNFRAPLLRARLGEAPICPVGLWLTFHERVPPPETDSLRLTVQVNGMDVGTSTKKPANIGGAHLSHRATSLSVNVP